MSINVGLSNWSVSKVDKLVELEAWMPYNASIMHFLTGLSSKGTGINGAKKGASNATVTEYFQYKFVVSQVFAMPGVKGSWICRTKTPVNATLVVPFAKRKSNPNFSSQNVEEIEALFGVKLP